jgi:hypothetical protein
MTATQPNATWCRCQKQDQHQPLAYKRENAAPLNVNLFHPKSKTLPPPPMGLKVNRALATVGSSDLKGCTLKVINESLRKLNIMLHCVIHIVRRNTVKCVYLPSSTIYIDKTNGSRAVTSMQFENA